jgi:hypothetical protein
MANEYGSAASAKLFGVEILNEGWGMSIDDSVNEMHATFVARIDRQHGRVHKLQHLRQDYQVPPVGRSTSALARGHPVAHRRPASIGPGTAGSAPHGSSPLPTPAAAPGVLDLNGFDGAPDSGILRKG